MLKRLLIAIAFCLLPSLASAATCTLSATPYPSNSPVAYNVRDFGARGDNSTDDTACVQAAYNASLTSSGTNAGHNTYTYLPPGNYNTTFPIIITNGGNAGNSSPGHLRGAGANGLPAPSEIDPQGNFPAIMVVPNDYVSSLGTISVSAIQGGVGNALQFNAGKPYALNLSELNADGSHPNWLNGLSNLGIGFFFETSAASGTEDLIASSGSGGMGFWTNDAALEFKFTAGGTAQVSMNIGGTVKTTPAGGTVAQNTVYYGEIDLDQTNGKLVLYICTPGAACNATGSVATGGGSITQTMHEMLAIGGLPQQWPNATVSNPFQGIVQNVIIKNVPLNSNGAPFTAPSANQAFGTSTLYGNNFTSIAPTKNGVSNTPVVSVDWLNGATQSDTWQTIYSESSHQTGSFELRDFNVRGGTIQVFTALSPNTDIENLHLYTGGYIGLYTFNNTYDSYLKHITVERLANNPAAGFGFGWEPGHGNELKAVGTNYGIACAQSGCGVLEHPIAVPGSGNQACFFFTSGQSSASDTEINDPECDAEGGGNVNGWECSGSTPSGYVNFKGGNLAAQGTGSPIVFDDNFAGGCPPARLFGTRLSNGTSTTNDINYAAANPSNTVELHGVDFIDNTGGTAVRSNHPELISAEGGITQNVTTVTGTSAGTAKLSEPLVTLTSRKVTVYLNGYENTTATPQTYTIPLAFGTAISAVNTISGNCAGFPQPTLTTITLPSSMGATQTGLCEFTGY